MATVTRNTAYYRNVAYDAEQKCQWAKAAKYYKLAAKHHKGNPKISQLAKRDIEFLLSQARQNEWAAKNLK